MSYHSMRITPTFFGWSQALTLGLEDPAAAQVSKAHVHAYVNAFYFGEDDLHNWIKVIAQNVSFFCVVFV